MNVPLNVIQYYTMSSSALYVILYRRWPGCKRSGRLCLSEATPPLRLLMSENNPTSNQGYEPQDHPDEVAMKHLAFG